MIKREDIVKIGQFAKPHGVKGEISLVTACGAFGDSENSCLICEIDGILVPFFIEGYRYKSDTVILVKLENIDSDTTAKELVNRDVFYSLESMGNADASGAITWDNFIDYRIMDEIYGDLGEIIDVDDSTLNILFRVNYRERELLIPAVKEFIIEVNHESRVLTVSLPEGLFGL